MRVSREQASRNRELILECAARLFRERGFEGVGVDAVMREAGLTHGGFYGHFENKQDLIAQASALALTTSLHHWKRQGVAALIDTYLSPKHVSNPGRGCLLAALGSELGRQSARVQQAVSPILEEMLEWLGEGDRERGICRYASLVGALVLARNLPAEILAPVRRQLRTNLPDRSAAQSEPSPETPADSR